MVARQRKTPSFEQALEEFERLVERMETGDLSLEDSLKAFERGIELSRACQEVLNEADQRIQILTEQNGKLADEPFRKDDE
ncbi:MAG: exodeoxyribonuclease VII small subunit [Gammaproteobacteria bacterium]|jgi:exodeoxyribonuclease VII small subunit|nr:exodeoxyribonuclease VII small subunit [Gammaproteobacteria bacterium]